MTTLPSVPIIVFTDGACTGNPGPGGWGSIVALPDGTVQELGGGARDTTNNRMEMAAAIHALGSLSAGQAVSIILYTDSTYLIKGITQWVFGWRSKGWLTAEGKPVVNKDLWEELLRHVARLKPTTIQWKYVRGHAGNPGNERCDHIAVAFANGRSEPLYKGDRDGYFVDLNELPPEQALPEQKKSGSPSAKGSSSGPATYLSYHNGVLMRHKTWSDCERQVKGKSNAKFKKVKSASEEKETLTSWGLSPDTAFQ